MSSSADPSPGAKELAKASAGKDSLTLRSRVQRAARPRPPCSPPERPSAGAADEELWQQIWEQVEGRHPQAACTRPAFSCAEVANELQACDVKRRRIVGKQPCLAIVVYRRRLNGKQPPPQPTHVLRAGRGVRGHYDVLGLQRTASAAQIHAAYRRRALVTHPDKGGNPDDFRRVVAAFEELADASRRAAYDRSLDLFGRLDGSTRNEAETEEHPVRPKRTSEAGHACLSTARVAHVRLLKISPAIWSQALEDLPELALEALGNLLQGPQMFAQSTDDNFQAEAGKMSAGQGPMCISQHRNGYKVTVTWASLQVATGFTKSLAQAIDWQIVLLWLRSVAEGRMKRHSQRSAAEPLTPEELLQVLDLEPVMELTFTISVRLNGSKGKKISSPAVQDLSLALDFLRRFSAAFQGRSASEAALQKVKRQAEKDAKQARQARKTAERKLLAAVVKELASRRGDAEPLGKRRKRKASGSISMATKPTEETRIVLWRPMWRICGKTPRDSFSWTF